MGYRYGGDLYDGRQPSSDLHAVFRNGYNGDDRGDGTYVGRDQTCGRADVYGERIAREVLERLKAPKKLTDTVCRLTALHMYDLDGKARAGKIRAFIVKNYDVYEPLLLLKQADYSGCKDDLNVCPTITKWENIRSEMEAEGVPFTLKQLAVRGNELKEIVPAPKTGEILNKLLLWCAQDGARNTKSALLAEAARLARQADKGE